MKRRYKWSVYALMVTALIYVWNASWWAGSGDHQLTVLAHRGVHHTFHTDNLTNDTCTAERIYSPSHNFIENTIPAFAEAVKFDAGMIELDIHPTTDGEFVVFHDWTLDCRTDGTGRTRDHDLASLKLLDIGFGYTSDGGETFPLRGQGVGLMPTLKEILAEFPETEFVINIKSRSAGEAHAVLDYIPDADWNRLSFVGHSIPIDIIGAARPDVVLINRPRAKACVKSYLLIGWTGIVPKACHNTYVPVPVNYRRLLWGWPDRFENRLNGVGSRSMLIGAYSGGPTIGIDHPEDLDDVPDTYTGIVFTNRAEVIGPLLTRRGQSDE